MEKMGGEREKGCQLQQYIHCEVVSFQRDDRTCKTKKPTLTTLVKHTRKT